MFRARDEGMNYKRLERITENKKCRGHRQHGDERIDVQCEKQNDAGIHGERHHFAVGEVHQAGHAEDHREAERHEPVNDAGQNAGDDDIGEDNKVHRHARMN